MSTKFEIAERNLGSGVLAESGEALKGVMGDNRYPTVTTKSKETSEDEHKF